MRRLFKPGRLVLMLIFALTTVGCSGSATPTANPSAAPSTGATSPTIDRIKQAGVLKVGAAIAMPVLGKDPATNEYVGAGTVLADELAKSLGVRVEYLDTDWNVIPAAIQSGKIDISVAGLWVTPTRLEALAMTPWFEAGFCYFALKESTKVSTPADINNPDVKVATFEGSGTYQSVLKAYPNATYITRPEVPGEYSAITELLAKKADIAPIDSTMVSVFLEKYPQLKVIPSDCSAHPDISGWMGAAYTKDDPAFKTYVDQLVKDIQPQLDEALKKFLESKYMKLGM